MNCDDRGRRTAADQRRETAVRCAGSGATEYSPGCPLSTLSFEGRTASGPQLTNLKCHPTFSAAPLQPSNLSPRTSRQNHAGLEPSARRRALKENTR